MARRQVPNAMQGVPNERPMARPTMTPEQAMVQQRAMQEIEMLEKNKIAKEMLDMQPKKIGEAEVRKASQILRKYKEGKDRLEKKLIANEEFWKLRQWNYMHDGKDDFKPATPWLWSCIESRYSDVMDSYPTCNIMPRQMDDREKQRFFLPSFRLYSNRTDTKRPIPM